MTNFKSYDNFISEDVKLTKHNVAEVAKYKIGDKIEVKKGSPEKYKDEYDTRYRNDTAWERWEGEVIGFEPGISVRNKEVFYILKRIWKHDSDSKTRYLVAEQYLEPAGKVDAVRKVFVDIINALKTRGFTFNEEDEGRSTAQVSRWTVHIHGTRLHGSVVNRSGYSTLHLSKAAEFYDKDQAEDFASGIRKLLDKNSKIFPNKYEQEVEIEEDEFRLSDGNLVEFLEQTGIDLEKLLGERKGAVVAKELGIT